MKKKLVVGITLGDPAGISPEIILKTLSEKDIYEACDPLVIGSGEPLKMALESTGLFLKLHPIMQVEDAVFAYGTVDYLDIPLGYKLVPGELKAENGSIAIQYMEKAVEMLRSGEIDATASAPCNKEAMKMAGSPFTGATEFFAHSAKIKKATTVIDQGGCYFFQITTHVSLRKALDSLDKELVTSSIVFADETLKKWGIISPRIAVSGINPHSGENGLLGSEEDDFVKPSVEDARKQGIDVCGPVPADVIFIKAYAGEYDAAILMFHDTANIAIKLMSSIKPAAVITAGLPFIRTTVAHGTAYDIAYRNVAAHEQFRTCLLSAASIAKRVINPN